MNNFLSILIGLSVRIVLPIGLTLLVIYLLRRLDQRWQKESLRLPVVPSGQKPCWEIKGCTAESRSECPAAAHPDIPCWQVFRKKNGMLKEDCLGCDVFRQAPVPVSI
jgi:hypothetical protein